MSTSAKWLAEETKTGRDIGESCPDLKIRNIYVAKQYSEKKISQIFSVLQETC